MKKVIAFFKSLFATPAEPVMVSTPVVEEAPKKKKRYYKPKNKA